MYTEKRTGCDKHCIVKIIEVSGSSTNVMFHFGYSNTEVIIMASYVSPAVRDKFESLSTNLKNCILERDVRLESVYDLIHVLEDIVAEDEE